MKNKMMIFDTCDYCPFFNNEVSPYEFDDSCLVLKRQVGRETSDEEFVSCKDFTVPSDCPFEDTDQEVSKLLTTQIEWNDHEPWRQPDGTMGDDLPGHHAGYDTVEVHHVSPGVVHKKFTRPKESA